MSSLSIAPKKHPPVAILYAVIALLGILTVASVLVAFWQLESANAIRAQSKTAMQAYAQLKEAKAPVGKGVQTGLRNIRFCWTAQTCAYINELSSTLLPTGTGPINADKPLSFYVNITGGDVRVAPDKFAGMLNDSVFNYPESALRDLAVSIQKRNGANTLNIAGKIHLLLWIPFNMDVALSVDRASNTLVMNVLDLKVLKVIPATWAIEIDPFNLDKLLPVPKNRHLSIIENNIKIKPFGLFPPPRIQGDMQTIEVGDKDIRLAFAGSPKSGLNTTGIRLKGGNMQFTRLAMWNTDVRIQARQTKETMTFSLGQYASLLPESTIKMGKSQDITVVMPSANIR